MNPDKTMADLIARETSLSARIKYIAMLVAGGGIASLVGALWVTESDLPLRTHLSFGAIVLVGLGWAGLAGWVLKNKRPLYALDRVIAASMALTASLIFAVGSVWITLTRATHLALLTVLAAGAMAVVTSASLLWAAIRRRRHLMHRLAEIERDVDAGSV